MCETRNAWDVWCAGRVVRGTCGVRDAWCVGRVMRGTRGAWDEWCVGRVVRGTRGAWDAWCGVYCTNSRQFYRRLRSTNVRPTSLDFVYRNFCSLVKQTDRC